MKTYEEFVNKDFPYDTTYMTPTDKLNRKMDKKSIAYKDVPQNFKFAVIVDKCNKRDINKAIKNIENHVDELSEYVKTNLKDNRYWAWIIKTELFHQYDFLNNVNVITFTCLSSDQFVTIDKITLKEFLEVGIEGVKNFINMKKTAKKYNISL